MSEFDPDLVPDPRLTYRSTYEVHALHVDEEGENPQHMGLTVDALQPEDAAQQIYEFIPKGNTVVDVSVTEPEPAPVDVSVTIDGYDAYVHISVDADDDSVIFGKMTIKYWYFPDSNEIALKRSDPIDANLIAVLKDEFGFGIDLDTCWNTDDADVDDELYDSDK